MHIMIVNFSLTGVTETEYFALCDQLAPAFADAAGLVAKSWLADAESNTYGGVYVWQDKQAMADFKASDLFNSVATHPNLDGVTSADFDVLPGPTEVTNGLI